jgi:polyvinyl alcohol dehydrogenase (cytochrome)
VLEDRLALSGINVVSGDPNDWPMYNHDIRGTRWDSAETRLSPDNVGGLKVQWTFATKAVVAGTPAVVEDRIYAADASGTAYALRRDGSLIWSSQVAGPVTDSLLVTNRTVIFGDLAGFIYGLDVNTGAELWKVRPNPHPTASIFGSATMVGPFVAIGIASVEELVAGQIPGYKPSFRGSVVLLDPADGRVVWQTYTITDAENAAGAAGAGVWSTPTYDRASDTIYVTTGNNYTEATTGTSDAIIALDADNGQVRWINQFTKSDSWNFSFPPSDANADFDFGDSPQIYRVDGRKVVGAGQKSGFYHVVDAATGADINPNQIQVEQGSQLGGLFADSAVAHGVVFANTSHWPAGFLGGAPISGGLAAIAGDGKKELWKYTTPLPNISGVAVANDVVYFQSIDGNLYALDAKDGSLLARVATGGQSSGPAVSRGRIYLGTGDALHLVADLQHPGPGSIVALGLDDDPGSSEPCAEHLEADRRGSHGAKPVGPRGQSGHGLSAIGDVRAQEVLAGDIGLALGNSGRAADLVPSPADRTEPALPALSAVGVEPIFGARAVVDWGFPSGGSRHKSWDAVLDGLNLGEGLGPFGPDWPTTRG